VQAAPASSAAPAAPAPSGELASNRSTGAPSTSGLMPPPPDRAPWATPPASISSSGGTASGRSISPATGSHFPQLARPLPGGAAVTGSSHDTMSPTAAPWALGGAPSPFPPTTPGIAATGTLSGPPGGPGAGIAALRRPGSGAGGGGALLSGRAAAPLVIAQPSMPRARPPQEQQQRQWEAPAKRIGSEEELRRFLEGEAAKDFVAFVLSLNQAVTGAPWPARFGPRLPRLSGVSGWAARRWAAAALLHAGSHQMGRRRCSPNPPTAPWTSPPNLGIRTGTKVSAPCPLSPPLAALAAALDALRALVDETPPTEQSLRYGNPAYRTWFAKMAAAAPRLIQQVGPRLSIRCSAVRLAPGVWSLGARRGSAPAHVDVGSQRTWAAA
jgi:hypothetical protein